MFFRRYSRWSIRHKLMLLMVSTTLGVVLLASGAFMVGDLLSLRRAMVQETAVLALAVGANCTGALSFEDPGTAADILQALAADPHLIHGVIYDEKSAPFAEYRAGAGPILTAGELLSGEWEEFTQDRLRVLRQIRQGGEVLGTIHLDRSLTALHQRLRQYLWLTTVVICGAGIAALLISLVLQHRLTDPMRHLAAVAEEVSRTRNFHARASVEGDDELALFARVFNQMLTEIEVRTRELQEAQARLEARVAERTTELETEVAERLRTQEALRLSQEQLLQAQKMEAIGRLAGGVAHDFNNQLTVIMGTSEMLLMRLKADDPNHGFVKSIFKSSQKSAALTRQLLAFGRKQILQPRLLDLNAMLREMDSTLQRLMPEGVNLRYQLTQNLGPVNADPVQLDQVVMNLVLNARDALGKGGTILVETAQYTLGHGAELGDPTLVPGPYVVLRVIDDGQGIAPEVLPRIFEPFYTTKDPGKGTGLGLSTVFGIVKQSGGHIQVSSTLGRGTVFTIYLPRSSGQLGVATAEIDRRLLEQTATVLLVEDDDEVRQMIMASLRRHGCVVVEAANAGEAIMLAEDLSQPIDLLLSDIVMPRVNGRELALRLLKLRPGLRLLLMTGYTDDTLVKYGVREGQFPLLNKPFTGEALIAKVRAVLTEPPPPVPVEKLEP